MQRVRDHALRTLLALVSPREADGDLRGLKDARIMRATAALARKNGLYYAFVASLRAREEPLPAGETPHAEAEWDALNRFRRTLRLVDDVAREEGLRYAVIKRIRSIPHVPRDVDVFVRSGDRDRFVAALEARGLVPLHRSPAELSLVGPDAYRIDLYSQIEYFGRLFLGEDLIERSRTPTTTQGLPHMGLVGEVEFLLNAIHDLFGHGATSLLDYVDLSELRETTNPSAVNSFAESLGWGKVLAAWLGRLDALDRDIAGGRTPVFPARHGWRFRRRCVQLLDGPVGARDGGALPLSFLWDDLVSASERWGLSDVLRGSSVARGWANRAGHRLRLTRGDRKGPGGPTIEEGG